MGKDNKRAYINKMEKEKTIQLFNKTELVLCKD